MSTAHTTHSARSPVAKRVAMLSFLVSVVSSPGQAEVIIRGAFVNGIDSDPYNPRQGVEIARATVNDGAEDVLREPSFSDGSGQFEVSVDAKKNDLVKLHYRKEDFTIVASFGQLRIEVADGQSQKLDYRSSVYSPQSIRDNPAQFIESASNKLREWAARSSNPDRLLVDEYEHLKRSGVKADFVDSIRLKFMMKPVEPMTHIDLREMPVDSGERAILPGDIRNPGIGDKLIAPGALEQLRQDQLELQN